MAEQDKHPAPFRFDGHGINDANGKRLAKVTTEQWTAGRRTEIDPEFKRLSLLLAAAPVLLDALETLFEEYKQLADCGDCGFWKAEDQPEGIKAIAAIRQAKGEGV